MITNQVLLAKSGGSSSGGSKSSSGSKSNTSSSTKSSTKSTKSESKSQSIPAAPKVNTKPSTTTKKTTTAQKPSNEATKTTNKKYSNTGYTVDEGYQPRFQGGYTAPMGSTVYYPSYSPLDYLIFWHIFNGNSEKQQTAVVVQPDGKEQVVKQESTDPLYVVNWIVLVLLVIGVCAGIVFLVNKLTKKKKQDDKSLTY
jgi:cobalamin biosynthesis Mg chelatase CobN